MGLIAALLLFTCVLLHELGHSLAALASGIPVARVTLFVFGGVAQIADEPRRPGMELKIALAGPLVSAALAALCWWLARTLPVHTAWQLAVWAVVRYLVVINISILFFNLLPGFPLDGGRILRAVLWAGTGQPRLATRIASQLGHLLGVALMAWGVWVAAHGAWMSGAWYLLLGSFLRNAALASYRRASG